MLRVDLRELARAPVETRGELGQADPLLEGLDVALTIPLWKEARIVLGKQKEPFVYEMVGDAANLPQQERILSPFFVSRNVGIRYLDNYLSDRMSFSLGIYNDWIENETFIIKHSVYFRLSWAWTKGWQFIMGHNAA